MTWAESLGLFKSRGRNICVLGYDTHVLESLFLKELAARDDVAHLYYIPIDSEDPREFHSDAALRNDDIYQSTRYARREHKDGNLGRMNHLYGYDLKEALTQDDLSGADTQAIDARILDVMSKPKTPERIAMKSIDMAVAKRFSANDAISLQDLLPRSIYWLNDPIATKRYGSKSYLEKLSRDVPMVAACKNISSPMAAVRYMESFGDDGIVVKTANSVASNGVGRIMFEQDGRYMVEAPQDFRSSTFSEPCETTQDGLLHFPFEQMRLPCGGALAMRAMDASKGDIRVVVMHGDIIGAYKRMPKGWLCSGENKASRVPVDLQEELLPEDYAALKQTAEHLRDDGVNWASIDLLEDYEGHRKISEFNTSYTIDFTHIEEVVPHADVMAREKRPSELAADAAMDALHAHQDKEVAMAEKYGQKTANLPAF